MVEAIIEFTNLNVDQVWKMPAQDFFAYLGYINERNRRRVLQQRQKLQRMKARRK